MGAHEQHSITHSITITQFREHERVTALEQHVDGLLEKLHVDIGSPRAVCHWFSVVVAVVGNCNVHAEHTRRTHLRFKQDRLAMCVKAVVVEEIALQLRTCA